MNDKHAAEDMDVAKLPIQRLCNEIQLFDLCDLEKCSFKEGRFCTNTELLTAFERISDAEVARSEVFVSDELEEGEDAYGEESDEEFGDDGCGDEPEYEDD